MQACAERQIDGPRVNSSHAEDRHERCSRQKARRLQLDLSVLVCWHLHALALTTSHNFIVPQVKFSHLLGSSIASKLHPHVFAYIEGTPIRMYDSMLSDSVMFDHVI